MWVLLPQVWVRWTGRPDWAPRLDAAANPVGLAANYSMPNQVNGLERVSLTAIDSMPNQVNGLEAGEPVINGFPFRV
jgi:hypothetical protein